MSSASHMAQWRRKGTLRPVLVPVVWLAAGSSATAAGADAWTLPRLREEHERNAQALGLDYEAEIEYLCHPCEKPDRKRGAGPSGQMRDRRVRYLFSGVRFRVDRWTLRASDDSPERLVQTGDRSTQVHDGRQFRHLNVWRSLPSDSGPIMSGLIKLLETDEYSRKNRALLRRRAADVSMSCWPREVPPQFFDGAWSRIVPDPERPDECAIEFTYRGRLGTMGGRKIAKQRVGFMLAKGCVISRARGLDERGRSVFEYTAEDIRKAGPVWLAHRATVLQFALVKGEAKTTRHVSVHLRRLILKPEISPGAFQVSFPPGTKVNDLIADRVYVVGKPPRL